MEQNEMVRGSHGNRPDLQRAGPKANAGVSPLRFAPVEMTYLLHRERPILFGMTRNANGHPSGEGWPFAVLGRV